MRQTLRREWDVWEKLICCTVGFLRYASIGPCTFFVAFHSIDKKNKRINVFFSFFFELSWYLYVTAMFSGGGGLEGTLMFSNNFHRQPFPCTYTPLRWQKLSVI